MLITEDRKRDGTTNFSIIKFMNGKKSPDGSKFIIRHYHYWSDTKLDPGIFSMRRIPCSWHACTTIWSISWYSKTKEAVNHPRYGTVYN